jgi:hypothetical protein
MARRPGRNEPCPCGSGRKFKQCCESKRDGFPSSVLALLIAGVIIAALLVAFSSARSSTGQGRVWSPEHGHYHDASGREVPR